MLKSLIPARKEPSMSDPNPPIARLVPPVAKPLHESAGEFANSVLELQREKADLEAKVVDLTTSLTNSAARIAALEDAKADIQTRLDYYHRRYVEVETKMGTVASIILDVMRESPNEPLPAQAPSAPSGREAPSGPPPTTPTLRMEDLI